MAQLGQWKMFLDIISGGALYIPHFKRINIFQEVILILIFCVSELGIKMASMLILQ